MIDIDVDIDGQMSGMLIKAFTLGPASRTDLLALAVSGRASTGVLNVLLGLPERRYHDLADLRDQLGFSTC